MFSSPTHITKTVYLLPTFHSQAGTLAVTSSGDKTVCICCIDGVLPLNPPPAYSPPESPMTTQPSTYLPTCLQVNCPLNPPRPLSGHVHRCVPRHPQRGADLRRGQQTWHSQLPRQHQKLREGAFGECQRYPLGLRVRAGCKLGEVTLSLSTNPLWLCWV